MWAHCLCLLCLITFFVAAFFACNHWPNKKSLSHTNDPDHDARNLRDAKSEVGILCLETDPIAVKVNTSYY